MEPHPASRRNRSDRGETRPAAVSGLFYPSEASELAEQVDSFLRAPGPSRPRCAIGSRVIVAPHAGYQYSGRWAGLAFSRLAAKGVESDTSELVFLLGPCHRVWVSGFALSPASQFSTPLGDVQVDEEVSRHLLERPDVVVSERAHAEEHSLEVLLPFVQRTFGSRVKIVPLLVGGASPDAVCDLLQPFVGRAHFVFSSDLSHFLDEPTARRRDARTLERLVRAESADLTPEDACGAAALNGLIVLTQQEKLVPHLLSSGTSAEAGGSRDRVVGYAALEFSGNP